MYKGKDFEEDFKKSFEGEQADRVIRLYDTTNGFSGIKNPCDYIMYSTPNMVMLELKVCQGKSLPFSNITEFQWYELERRGRISGIEAGILVMYYGERRCFYVPMRILHQIEPHRKSLHLADAIRYGLEVTLNFRRTRCTLNVDKFIYDINVKNFVDKISEVEEFESAKSGRS